MVCFTVFWQFWSKQHLSNRTKHFFRCFVFFGTGRTKLSSPFTIHHCMAATPRKIHYEKQLMDFFLFPGLKDVNAGSIHCKILFSWMVAKFLDADCREVVEDQDLVNVICSLCFPPRVFFLPPRNLFVLPNGFLQLSSRLLRTKFSPTLLVQHWPFLSTDMLSLFHIDMFYVDIQSFQLQVLMVHGT